MNFLSRIFSRRRVHPRVDARLRLTIGTHEEHYWTQDISLVGIRMAIGRQLSLADLTGGNREVPLSIELQDDCIIKVFGEPIRVVRMDDSRLSTGWMLSRFEGDAETRLEAFIASYV